MAYTEVKERNEKRYYYRVISVRKGEKISKARKYLGVNLRKEELSLKERAADKEFSLLYQDKKKRILGNIKKKIIAFFGPTSSSEIHLYNRGIKIIPAINCLVCYKNTCDIKPNCMDLISPEMIINATKKLI